ncbi:MAG: formyltetrahydrofolate deformylase [Actinomycetales bacterium]|nr:formyltetrahydrofolate deformylase [Actinomycetales bacterium]
MSTYLLTFRCQDAPGIIHAVSGALLEVGANVLEQAQFTDQDSGLFAMRTRFEAPDQQPESIRQVVLEQAGRFDPVIAVRAETQRRRALVMVSRQDHCLVDLLYRYEIGELDVEIPLVVSNHEDCRGVAERHGIPFVVLPVTPETKSDQEQRLLELVREHEVDVVVLARYMQVLSDSLCAELPGRIINIHHSFLPGFKGARPYHQAHARGVKLIGATAHFVTADLDEGPIIEQGVERVDHSATPEALAEIGRDVERLVLARAVRLFAEDRIVLDGARTIVFR